MASLKAVPNILPSGYVLAGDQTLFVRRKHFEGSGGFREDLAIMEDADISIRLHSGNPLSSPSKAPHTPFSSQSLQNGVPGIQGPSEGNVQFCGAINRSTQQEQGEASALPSPSHALPVHVLAQSSASSVLDGESMKSSEKGPYGRLRRLHKRRRIRHVLYRSNVTSGRRMAEWGPWKSTFLHFKFGLMWYFGCSSVQLQRAYDELYTDAYR
jgi:hypothetical protein